MLLTVGVPLFSENIRGSVAGSVTEGGEPVMFNPEQLVVVENRETGDFRDGVELRVQIPEGLRRYQNSFALMIFKNVNPVPSSDTQSYRGGRAFMRLLPTRDTMFVRIPFSDSHEITGDALTDVLPVAVDADDFPLLVTVLPVMKGIPDRAFSETLTISAVTLLRNEGTLTVNLTNPTGDPDEVLTISIDGTPVAPGTPIALEAGLHHVRVDSSAAPTIEKNIALEPGEEAILEIELDYRAPEVVVTVPDGAQLLLDGKLISGSDTPTSLAVEPGNHTVTYKLGDFEVSRTFNIRPGGKVNIDLSVDISIVDFSESGGNPFGAGDG